MTPRKCTMPLLLVLGVLGLNLSGFDAKARPVIGTPPSGAVVPQSAPAGLAVGSPIAVTNIDPIKRTIFILFGAGDVPSELFDIRCEHTKDENDNYGECREIPAKVRATATASIVSTSGKTITGFSDLHGGSGYSNNPHANIRDGADGRGPGRGATASAIIGVNDFTSACWIDADNPTQFDPKLGTDEEAVCWKVTKLELTNPGFGYTDPRVVIQPSYTTDHKPKFTIINSSSLGGGRTIYKADNRAILRISSSSGYNTLSCTTITVRKNGNVHSSHDVKIADGRIVFSVDSNDTDKDIGRWEPGLSVDTFACAPDANANNDATANVTTVSGSGGVEVSVSMSGKGYDPDNPPTVTIGAPAQGGTQATATATVVNGGIQIRMTNPGSGYTAAPTVAIDPPPNPTPITSTKVQLVARGDVSWTLGDTHTLTLRVREHEPRSSAYLTFTVTVKNDDLELKPSPNDPILKTYTIDIGQEWSLTLPEAIGGAGGPYTYALKRMGTVLAPINFDPSTRVITTGWYDPYSTPGCANGCSLGNKRAGTHEFEYVIKDRAGNSKTYTGLKVKVVEPVLPDPDASGKDTPVFKKKIPNQVITLGDNNNPVILAAPWYPATCEQSCNPAYGYTATHSRGLDVSGPNFFHYNSTNKILSGRLKRSVALNSLRPNDVITVTITATNNRENPDGNPVGSTTFTISIAQPLEVDIPKEVMAKRGGSFRLYPDVTFSKLGSKEISSFAWTIGSASNNELSALGDAKWITDGKGLFLVDPTANPVVFWLPRRKHMQDRQAIDDGQWFDLKVTATDGDGTAASDTARVTIRGTTWTSDITPAAMSVADATANESSGALSFTLSLDRPLTTRVTVDYKTSDGTARAGSDYESTTGTLAFDPGETSKTIPVPIIDDAHDEGSETFTLTLSNPTPGRAVNLADATATGSISNADPLQRDWLARFGRAAASDAIAAITARLETPRDAGSHVTVGGRRMPLDGSGATGAGLPPALPGGPGAPGWLSWSRDPQAGTKRTMSGRALLMGASFRAVLGEGAGPQFTGWGQGASVSRFSGAAPGLSFSGETATGTLGMDWESGRLLAGLAMTRSVGEGAAQGAGRRYSMGSTVTAVLPYARFAVSDRISAWGLAGSGSGQLTMDLDDGATERYRADLTMTLAATGVRGELLTPAEAGGFALAVKADAFLVRTESEAVSTPGVGNLAGARADASRLRAALDGSRTFALAGGTLTPRLELGVRHDGGDAETGTGMEIGAGLGYADPSRGLDMTLRVHGLAAHAEEDYDEWGVSGSLSLAPGAGGRGLSMSLTPSYGADPGGPERLWRQPDADGFAANGDAPPASRFDAELGYGMALFGGALTGTPNVGIGLSDTAREYRMGWRMNAAAVGAGGFEFNFDVTRRDQDAGAGHGIGVRATARW